MILNFENFNEQPMIYLRCTGPYGISNQHQMEIVKDWARENHLLNEDSIILGIPLDDPNTTKPEDCRYDIGLIMDSPSLGLQLQHKGENLAIGTTPNGKYGVFLIPHTAEDIQNAWQNIFAHLASEGCVFDPSRPIVERYAAKKIQAHQCEICIPIM